MTDEQPGKSSPLASSYLVKGCPCLMEFGSEQVCINNDDVVPVYVLDVPVELAIDAIGTPEETVKESGGVKLCYSIVDIGQPDGQAYCALHRQQLKINSTPIRSSDIEDAIQFVLFTESEKNSTCSSCIYKYLVTMGGIFEEDISPTDARLMLESFLAKAEKPERRESKSTGEKYRSILRAHLRELVQEKKIWSQIIDEQRDGDSQIYGMHLELLDLFRQTSRMEMVLHHQLLALYDKEKGPKTQPRLIRQAAIHLLRLCEKIHELDEILLEASVPQETKATIREHMTNRERIEDGLRTLLSVLSQKKQYVDSDAHRYSLDLGLI